MTVSAASSLLSRTLAPSAVRTGFFEMRLTEIREITPYLWVHPGRGTVNFAMQGAVEGRYHLSLRN